MFSRVLQQAVDTAERCILYLLFELQYQIFTSRLHITRCSKLISLSNCKSSREERVVAGNPISDSFSQAVSR